MKNLFGILALLALSGCGGLFIDDADWVMPRANAYYEARGFKVLGYQGYNMWTIGRCYWYTLARGPVTYESCLMKWGNEIHEYGLQAVDAVHGASR